MGVFNPIATCVFKADHVAVKAANGTTCVCVATANKGVGLASIIRVAVGVGTKEVAADWVPSALACIVCVIAWAIKAFCAIMVACTDDCVAFFLGR